MKRFVVRTAWLTLILAAATAFGQTLPKAGPTAEPAAPAKQPSLSASLLLIKADWSESPAAKDIDAELRAALKDATVPKALLDELPASGPQILFSPSVAVIYTPAHYRELMAWLKAKDLIVEQTPFRAEEGFIDVIVQYGRSNERREFLGKASKPYEFLDLPALPSAADQPFIARQAEFQWHVGEREKGSGSVWVERRLVVQQQTRGRQSPELDRPLDSCDFRWRSHIDSQVVIFDSLPPMQETQTFSSDATLANSAHRKGFVALVVVETAGGAATDNASAKLNLPDTVQTGIASKGRSYNWPEPRPFGGKKAKAATPSNVGGVFGGPPPAPAPNAGDSSAAPPVDANGKPAGSAARQVTDGKIIIAWSEGKDVAWGFSTSVGKWARQELNPPANGSSWPIVGGGSSAWQVGSAYYGFSGKVAQWDVVRLPDGHEPRPTVFQDFVVVNDGTAFYVFSGKTARWDVLRLPDSHKPTISFDTNYVRVSDGDDVYVFAEATGRWSSTKDAAGGAANELKPAVDSQIKVIQLQNARAADLARIISQIVGKEVASVVAEERTNTIIARGPPETLNVIVALLDRLEIQPDPKTKPAGVGIGGLSGTTKLDTTASAAELTKQYAAKEQQAAEIAAQLRELQAEKSSNKAQVQKLTADLRRAVAEAFAARQQLHQAELAELGQRMRQIEQTVQLRSRISEQIIDRRVQDLLNPDLEWDQLAQSRPGLPGAATTSTSPLSTSVPRPRVLVGTAFGSEADKICDALGLTVHRLTKDEIAATTLPGMVLPDPKLLGCLKITATAPPSRGDFHVGDIITMMQTEGDRGGLRKVTMRVLRGTEQIPMTAEIPSSLLATTKTDAATFPTDPAAADATDAQPTGSTPRPRVLVGAAFGAEADQICDALGLTVQRLKKEEISDQKLLGCLKITAISEGSPASDIKVGDIITMMQFEGSGGGLRRVSMNIRRDNRRRGTENIPVTVEFPAPAAAAEKDANSSPNEPSPSSTDATDSDQSANIKYGVRFGNQETKIWNTLGVKVVAVAKEDLPTSGYQGGAKITEIRPGSPAAGLHVGDIIVGLLNWDVTSPERLLWALSQPISNTSGRGQFFGKFWNVETAIIYFLRDKSSLQATIEFRLEPPPAAVPPPTPVDAGSAALSQAPPGNANLALPTSAAGQPLILRSADSFRQTIYDLEDRIKRHQRNIGKYKEALGAVQLLDQDEKAKKQFSLQSAEQTLAKDQAELAFARDEFASQIRLLELALQDAQSQAETAKQNARRIEQLLSNRVVSQEEAEKARQNASSAQSSVDQIVTLLDLYRKADPAKPAPTAATDDESTKPTGKPKQGGGQPR